MEELRRDWAARRAEMDQFGILQTFSDQLAREWAIETGQIENLYDIERGVTLSLIEQGFSAALLERGATNKPPDYVLALINDQKDALEGLFEFVKHDRPLSTSYTKELHAVMTRSQTVTEAVDPQGNRVEVPLLRGEWKKAPNFPIRGDKQFMYCPPEQAPSEMDRLVQMHLSHVDNSVPPEAMAAWLHHRFTQIHPFQDGNGRVARALASLVLIRAQMFPFVVPRDDRSSYLTAIEAADQGDLRPFVLTISRLQDTAYLRAVRIFSTQSPSSSTTREAAIALKASLKPMPSTRQIALRRELVRMARMFHQCLQESINNAGEELADTFPNFAQHSPGLVEFSLNDFGDGRRAVIEAFEGTPLDNLVRADWQFQSPFAWHLRMLVGAFGEPASTDVRATAYAVIPPGPEALVSEKISLPISAGDSEVHNIAGSWADQTFARALDTIRRHALQ